MEIAGKDYEIIVAPDEEEGTMNLECWDNAADELIIFVIYEIATEKFVFTALEEDLPLELVEKVVGMAKTRLLPGLNL
jgi:hypothetical protein